MLQPLRGMLPESYLQPLRLATLAKTRHEDACWQVRSSVAQPVLTISAKSWRIFDDILKQRCGYVLSAILAWVYFRRIPTPTCFPGMYLQSFRVCRHSRRTVPIEISCSELFMPPCWGGRIRSKCSYP